MTVSRRHALFGASWLGVTLMFAGVVGALVDPGFLKGQLHREGGVGFFLLALAMLVPVFVLLSRSEIANRSIGLPNSSRHYV